MSTDAEVAAKIRDAIAANPDPTVQTHEFQGRRVTRFNPLELLEAQGIAEARAYRSQHGLFQAARVSVPAPVSGEAIE